jgi:hypothetical protein
MPSRAMKPVWANHPVGSLLFALQSYNAAFTQNVLKRVGRLGVEAVKTKDPATCSSRRWAHRARRHERAAGLSADGPVRRQGEQGRRRDAVRLRILDRAGFTGMASPFFNALFGLKYHRSVSQSLQGSVLGRAGQAIDAGGGLFIGNSDNTNTAERKAAGCSTTWSSTRRRTPSARSTCAGQRALPQSWGQATKRAACFRATGTRSSMPLRVRVRRRGRKWPGG